MKNKLLLISLILIAFLLLFNNCSKDVAKKNHFENIKLKTICEVWGFLKYYHPYIAQGNVDWDKKLIDLLKISDTIYSVDDFNTLIHNTIRDIQIEANDIRIGDFDTLVFIRRDFDWLNSSSIISDENIIELQKIYNNRKTIDSYYFSQDIEVGNLFFENEKPYTDSIYPSKYLRLLSLFRYWNIIYYFHPYLEINDLNWENCLDQYIPKFINAQDTISYHLLVQEFASTINDGHIWTDSDILSKYWGYYSPFIKLKWVENKAIIYDYYSDSLAKVSLVKLGDQVISINNRNIDSIIESRKKYYSNSNPSQHMRRILEEILITNSPDSFNLSLVRNSDTFMVSLKPYFLFELYETQENENRKKFAYKILSDSIGYINLGLLEKVDIPDFIDQFLSLKKIIIDIRNYPNNVLYELSNYFNPKPSAFVKVIIPNKYTPGEFIYNQTLSAGFQNYKYYKGQVILLVNEQTQSHAEFTAMCLQSAPNVLTFGSTTAGTDGNVSYLYLPGGIITYFTGIAILYPDNSYTQRIGIKIDSIIEPQIIDFASKYDRLLNAAINY